MVRPAKGHEIDYWRRLSKKEQDWFRAYHYVFEKSTNDPKYIDLLKETAPDLDLSALEANGKTVKQNITRAKYVRFQDLLNVPTERVEATLDGIKKPYLYAEKSKYVHAIRRHRRDVLRKRG